MIRMNNKVLLPLGCFFLSIASVYAQYEYQPFVKEGKVWLMSGRSDKGDSYSYDFQYLMQGDTIIGGEVMKKVYLIDEVRFHDNSLHYLGAVKEVDKRVYITYADGSSPVLLYDFSIEPSKYSTPIVITRGGRYASAIYRVDLYQINSTLRHVQRGNRQYAPDVMEAIPYIVENFDGIGSVDGMDPFQYQLWGLSHIKMCYDDGACIYFGGDWDWDYTVEPTYYPLLRHRRCWEFSEPNEETANKVYVLGDTIFINEKFPDSGWLYRKVYCVDKSVYGDTDMHYYGAMREEGTKVYLVPDGKSVSERQLMFDFGLKNGEQVEVGGSVVKVVKTDSIISEGRKYNRLTLQLIENGKGTGRTCHWIEGIGSDCGLLQPLPWDSSDKMQLVVCDGENNIYTQLVETSICETVQEKKSGTKGVIYDLQGRQLQGKPEKGLYIKNGKKYVAR